MPTTYYPFGKTLADLAVTVYGRSMLVDPGTKVRFFSDEAMTTELVDIKAADGTTAVTPGTLTTLKTGAFPLFFLAVPEAWAFPVGAPADTEPMLMQCHQSALLGGALGSTDGLARAAAQAAQDTANAAVASLSFKADIDGGTGRLALDERPQTYAGVLQLPGTAAVGRINPGGLLVGYETLLTYVVLTASRAPLGSAASVTVKSRNWGNTAYNTPVVLALPVGQRRVVMAMTDVLDTGDRLYADITAVGSTAPGGDYTVQFLGVGASTVPTLMAVPSAPTGVTTTVNSGTQNTITWTAGAGGGPVTTYHVYAVLSGVTTWLGDVEAGTTTFVHVYATGSYSAYSVVASNDDVSSVSAGAGAGFLDALPQANGVLNPTNFFSSKGSAAAAQFTVTSNRAIGTSGATGSDSALDKQMVRDILDPVRKAGEIWGRFQLSSANGGAQWYISCNDYDLSTGGSAQTYLNVQFWTVGWRIVTRTSSGSYTVLANANWATALSVATDYGFRFLADVVDPIAGTQGLHMYQGSAATYGTDPLTLPNIANTTVPKATRDLIPAGHMVVQNIGNQTASATSVSTNYDKLRFWVGAS